MADHGIILAWSTPYWESVGILDWTSLALGGQGHINHGMMMWRTGGVSVGGGQGLNCRVKARVIHLTKTITFLGIHYLTCFHQLEYQNTFLDWLFPIGLNVNSLFVVNLMHEVELGVWKSLMIHLLQILADSCDTLWFLWLCVIIHLKSHTKLQHPLITQYVLHIVYPYHINPLSISVPCYCHPTPSLSCFTYYFQYFLYFIFSPYLSSVIHCWLLCTLFLM